MAELAFCYFFEGEEVILTQGQVNDTNEIMRHHWRVNPL